MKWILIALVGAVAVVALIGAAAGVVAINNVQQIAGTTITWGAQAHVGALQTRVHTVSPGAARSVQVALTVGAGAVHVRGGADALMVGRFASNVATWQPVTTYVVRDQQGQLTVRQPTTDDMLRTPDQARNTWDVRLSNHIPLRLSVTEGAGMTDLTLRSLTLTGLDVHVGAGESHIDLAGAWTHSFAAAIHSGVGDLTVLLPSRVGVRVTANGGGFRDLRSGDLRRDGDAYVNAAYGASPVTVHVSIAQGLGSIALHTDQGGIS